MKKKTKIIIAVSLLVAIVLGIYLSSTSTMASFSLNASSELIGNVSVEFKYCNWWCKLLHSEQETYFKTPLSIPVGTKTTICESVGIYNRCDTYDIKNTYIHVFKNGVDIAVIPVTIPCHNAPNGDEYCTTYTPSSAGTYTASLYLWLSKKGANSFSEIKNTQTNSLIVTAASTPACTKAEYSLGDWVVIKEIDGGKVEQRQQLVLNPATCTYENKGGYSSYVRTICNSGYTGGSSSRETTCTLIPVEEPVVDDVVVPDDTIIPDNTDDVVVPDDTDTSDTNDDSMTEIKIPVITQVIFWVISIAILGLVIFIIYRLVNSRK